MKFPKKQDMSQKQLKELLHYDSESGIFTWINNRHHKVKVGDRAGCSHKILNGKTYRRIKINGKNYYENVLAFVYMKGIYPDETDHSNGNGEDNRWSNLTDGTAHDNMTNKKLYISNKTGVPGISFRKKAQLYIVFIGKIYLGCSKSLFEAICLRKSAELECGYHKNHGQVRSL